MPSVLRRSVLCVSSLRREVALAHVCASAVLFARVVRAGTTPACIMLSLPLLNSARQLSRYKAPRGHSQHVVMATEIINKTLEHIIYCIDIYKYQIKILTNNDHDHDEFSQLMTN